MNFFKQCLMFGSIILVFIPDSKSSAISDCIKILRGLLPFEFSQKKVVEVPAPIRLFSAYQDESMKTEVQKLIDSGMTSVENRFLINREGKYLGKLNGKAPEYKKCIASSILSNFYGLSVVKETFEVIRNGKVYSFQIFADQFELSYKTKLTAWSEQVFELALQDMLQAERDRHGGNLMIGPGGKLAAIDNEMSFPDDFVCDLKFDCHADRKWEWLEWYGDSKLSVPFNAKLRQVILEKDISILIEELKRLDLIGSHALDFLRARVLLLRSIMTDQPEAKINDIAKFFYQFIQGNEPIFFPNQNKIFEKSIEMAAGHSETQDLLRRAMNRKN